MEEKEEIMVRKVIVLVGGSKALTIRVRVVIHHVELLQIINVLVMVLVIKAPVKVKVV